MPDYGYTHNEIRQMKRRRYRCATYDYEGNLDMPGRVVSPRGDGPHVPNKNEAHVLRRLMSQTGLTAEEVRERKTYRVMLSEAQKKQGPHTRADRLVRQVLKEVTRELVLPKEHPRVKAAFETIWNERIRTWRRFDVVQMDAEEAWGRLGIVYYSNVTSGKVLSGAADSSLHM